MPVRFPIGGFFELERSSGVKRDFPLNAVNSGRSGLELILRHYRPSKLWIPFFICNCVPEFLTSIGQLYDRYHVDAQLEMVHPIDLRSGEMLLYVNYFGIKDSYCDILQKQYGHSLILDLTQAFFYQNKAKCPSFSSLRKFFGVPDGGFVTGVPQGDIDVLPMANGAEHAAHLIYRADGKQAEAYQFFLDNSRHFEHDHPLQMSRLAYHIMCGVSIKGVQEARQRNYCHLYQAFNKINRLAPLESKIAPLSYPFLVEDGDAIRKELIASSIFIPKYWPGLEELNDDEQNAVDNIIHLPIDQRYGIKEMDIILERLL